MKPAARVRKSEDRDPKTEHRSKDGLETLFASLSHAADEVPLVALAAIVGLPVEVPVMLSVCNVCNRTREWFAGAAMARV